MPKTSYPRDRFDDLADETGRLGAHRAENPRMRAGLVLLWAAVATVVLIAIGIFGTLVVTDRISLFPSSAPTPAQTSIIEPVTDTSSTVIVLNASGEAGLATQVKETLVAAGWTAESVLPGDAGSPFETTTVYYSLPEDESAAAGVAEAIGGAAIAQSDAYDAYPVEDDPDTEVDEAEALRFVAVLGTDRAATAPPAP